MGWTTGVQFPAGLGISFSSPSHPGVKRPGKARHSFPSSAVFKNAWSYTSTPPIRIHGVVLN